LDGQFRPGQTGRKTQSLEALPKRKVGFCLDTIEAQRRACITSQSTSRDNQRATTTTGECPRLGALWSCVEEAPNGLPAYTEFLGNRFKSQTAGP
jgi:hypothetical protein